MAPKSGKMSREEKLLLCSTEMHLFGLQSLFGSTGGSRHCLIPRHLCHRHPGLYLAPGLRLQAHPPKHKVAVQREGAVTKEMTKKLADDKKIIKKGKDENEVIINEYLD